MRGVVAMFMSIGELDGIGASVGELLEVGDLGGMDLEIR